MTDTISFIPDYKESPEQAAEYLRLTLPFLSRHGLPVNPINYAIGYDYVAGHNRHLRTTIDRLVANHQPLTPDLCAQLYREYILDPAAKKFEKIGGSLRELVRNTLKEVEHTERQAALSATRLQQQADVLERQPPEQIITVLDHLIQETQSLVAAGNELQSHLRATHQEIVQLRAELEMMKEAAFTDALTGLLNRRAFDLKMQALFAAPPSSAFLLLLDLDHFKKINDQHGHLTGDKALRHTAKIIRETLPEGQVAARFGGEEMAVLLSNLPYRSAVQIAETIRTRMAKSRLQRRDSQEPIGQITLSIGIAALQPDDTIDSFIERADQALYEAKRQGRNRVVTDRSLQQTA